MKFLIFKIKTSILSDEENSFTTKKKTLFTQIGNNKVKSNLESDLGGEYDFVYVAKKK